MVAGINFRLKTNYPDIHVHHYDTHTVLFQFKNSDDVECNPIVCFCLRIFKDMSIRLWNNGVEVHSKYFKSLLSNTKSVLGLWSQFCEVLRYRKDIPEVDNVTKSGHIAREIIKLGDLSDNEKAYNFLAEQLNLLCQPPSRYRYTTDTLIFAFQIYHKSSSSYLELRQLLCLPSIRLLQSVSSNLDVSDSNTCITFLKSKAALLTPDELLVNVQLDEIYVKPKIQYKGDKIVGYAENKDQALASRIQCFMISSIKSKNKDVISLTPVQNMVAADLHQLILQVINNVTKAGFRIISLISDNNIINRNSFKLLSGTDVLKPYIINPVNKEDKIYIIFDTVHLLKCVRNNWINLRNNQKTFDFPDMTDKNTILAASFSHFEVMYNMEQTSLVKQATRLNYKSLHPHSIERQNVKLVLRIFCDSTAAALQTLGPHNEQLPNWEGTLVFVKTILKFWNIVNVKSSYKGKHKRFDDAHPIRDLKDTRISWMVDFVSWLQDWKLYSEHNKTTCLTAETYVALRHTVNTIIYMIHDLLNNNILDYILLGKFQTDNLESRFGQYRMLSGCNYLISVPEVMQSEKKLRIKSLLKLHASQGDINVHTFLSKFSEIKKSKRDIAFILQFPLCSIPTPKKEDLPALLMVTGYVAKSTMAKICCVSCKQMFGSRELESLNLDIDSNVLCYFDTINRGGLTYPSNMLFNTIQCAYNIFNTCISEHEAKFIKVVNQKQTLIGLFEKHITILDYFIHHLVPCEVCGCEVVTNVMRSLSCFANILLKNYSTNKSEAVSIAKISRKVLKF